MQTEKPIEIAADESHPDSVRLQVCVSHLLSTTSGICLMP